MSLWRELANNMIALLKARQPDLPNNGQSTDSNPAPLDPTLPQKRKDDPHDLSADVLRIMRVNRRSMTREQHLFSNGPYFSKGSYKEKPANDNMDQAEQINSVKPKTRPKK